MINANMRTYNHKMQIGSDSFLPICIFRISLFDYRQAQDIEPIHALKLFQSC